MNCTQVENLLPLYAGGDVGAEDGRAVAAHLVSCDACRALADEWGWSRTLLRSYEPPAFDAAFFDSVRGGVMGEIARAPRPRLPLAAALAQLFRPRALAFASALALVLFAGALALRLSRGGAANVHTPASDLAVINPRLRLPAPTGERPGQRQAGGREQSVAHHSQRRSSPAFTRTPSPDFDLAHAERRRGLKRDAALPAPPPDETARANPPAPERGAQPDAATGLTELAALDDRPVLRIELQTADPNVRIIWLSPQVAGTGAPKK